MAPPNTPVNKPTAVGHLLMGWGSNDTVESLKSRYAKIRFDAVDVLNIAAFRVDDSDRKTFRFEHSELDKIDLLKWLITTARTRHSSIKILAQQWWSPSTTPIPNVAWMSLDKTHINTYAASVAAVVKQYELDGYDVDYEDGNYVPEAPAILAAVRAELDALSKTVKRPLYLTLSPASTIHLSSNTHPISKSVDWVNIQTYSGGWESHNNNSVQSWLGLGFSSTQLLYGILPESTPKAGDPTSYGTDGYSPTMDMVQKQVTSHNLGGINLWRLNSGTLIFESQVQVLMYNFLHKTTLDNSPDPAEVKKIWDAGAKAQEALT